MINREVHSHDRPSTRHQLLPRYVCVAEHDSDHVKERAEGDDDATDKILRKMDLVA